MPMRLALLLCLFFTLHQIQCYVYFQKDQSEIKDGTLNENAIGTPHGIKKRATATGLKERLWDHGIIPYEIDETWTSHKKALVRQAMSHWENFTCLKFIERNKSQSMDYVFFTEQPCGCCSSVGRKGNGVQTLSIGEACNKFGIIVHEIGHAIGYYHEHTRPDRDNYVRVFHENIMQGQHANFDKLPVDQAISVGVKYDYGSIMHYAKNTYSKDGFMETIQAIKTSGTIPEIGQRVALSQEDINHVLALYNCPKCGRTFHTESGRFAPPPSDFNSPTLCEWRINASPGEKIVLNITSMDILKSPNCSVNYLEVKDGYWNNSKLLGRFCGRGNLLELTSETNRMFLTYVTQQINDQDTFLGEFQVICGGELSVDSMAYLASPNYPDDYGANKECIWKITVPETYRVALTFTSFDVEHHVECSYDFVSVYNGHLGKNATLLNRLCGYSIPENLLSLGNEMTVRFVTDKTTERGGFSAKIYAEYNECEKVNHGCEQLCINTLRGFRCSCKPGYELHSNKKSCVDFCGGTFTAFNDTISSPSHPEFPDVYPERKHCVWQIEAPPNHVIFFNFTYLDIEGNNLEHETTPFQLCEFDRVSLFTLTAYGRYKPIGTICGTKAPKVFVSESNRLKVTFESDATIQGSGFVADYFIDADECSTDNGGCEQDCTNTLGSFYCSCRTGYVLNDDRKTCARRCMKEIFAKFSPPKFGVIKSPNYPRYYSASQECAWFLHTLPGQRIVLKFNHFDLEYHPECYTDRLEVFDGNSEKSHQTGSFCGTIQPDPIYSISNKLYLTFKSDSSGQRKGFFATFYSLCGGFLQAAKEPSRIYSHSEFNVTAYSPFESCDWIIFGKEGYQIKIAFKEFDLEQDENCFFDYLEVRTGYDIGSENFLGKFCGNNNTREITTDEEQIVLKFRTDDQVQGRGFILEYQLVEENKDESSIK